MRLVEVTHAPTPDRRDALVAFIERLTGQAGSRPLSDHLWLDLKEGGGPDLIQLLPGLQSQTRDARKVNGCRNFFVIHPFYSHRLQFLTSDVSFILDTRFDL